MNTELAFVGLVTALAYWRRYQWLYAIAFFAQIMIGWQWIEEANGPYYAAVMLMLSLYTGWRAIAPIFGR